MDIENTDNINKIQNEIENKKDNNENNQIQIIKTNQEPQPVKKKISFKEAQQSIIEFKEIVEDIEKKIKNKYGDCLPDFSCEEQLPSSLKTKLITSFFESEEIKNIINKMNQEKK